MIHNRQQSLKVILFEDVIKRFGGHAQTNVHTHTNLLTVTTLLVTKCRHTGRECNYFKKIRVLLNSFLREQ